MTVKKTKKNSKSNFLAFFPEKKAMEMAMLVIIIITLVSFVLIAYSIREFVTKAEPKEAESLCHTSLAARASNRHNLVVTEVGTPILCKTIDETFSAETKEEAAELISRKMERCWWIWLEGKYSEILWSGVTGDFNKPQCFVCYNLIYEEGPEFTQDDLLQSLIDTNTKYRADGGVINYIQETGYVKNFEDKIEPNNVYSIVFANNIKDTVWTNLGGIVTDLPDLDKNGVWLSQLNRLQNNQYCYNGGDFVGE